MSDKNIFRDSIRTADQHEYGAVFALPTPVLRRMSGIVCPIRLHRQS